MAHVLELDTSAKSHTLEAVVPGLAKEADAVATAVIRFSRSSATMRASFLAFLFCFMQ